MSSRQILTLLSGVGGSNTTGSAMQWAGGPFVLLGNWSGTNGNDGLTIQVSPDGTNWSLPQNLTVNPAANAALYALPGGNELPPIFVRGVYSAGSGVHVSNLTLVMQGYDGADHVTTTFSN